MSRGVQKDRKEMVFGGLYEEYGRPFTGTKLKKLKDFLAKEGLSYDETVEYTFLLSNDEGNIAAAGSVSGNVFKCIAVSDEYQGEGLAAVIVTGLMKYAIENGRDHIFLFTKPKNLAMFSDLGFYRIISTEDILFMENRRDGIEKFAAELSAESAESCRAFAEKNGREPLCGAIVANCNPFTLGHRYLIESALSECDILHLFILSEDRSEFSALDRYRMVEEGIKDLDRIILHKTSDYLISQATFPTYFIKDKVKAGDANCELDVRIFCECFAEPLKIKKRFAGTEPGDAVTNAYNEAMRRILPAYGIEFVEIRRKETEKGIPVSAGEARRCLKNGDYESLKALLPESTVNYLLPSQKSI